MKNIKNGKIMRNNHDNGCLWWKDWHSCSCGYLEEEVRQQAEICSQVIPNTFIMCGEEYGSKKQYCSTYCYNKSIGEK